MITRRERVHELRAKADTLAGLLVDHVRATSMFDVAELARDPLGALTDSNVMTVAYVDPWQLPIGCSIAACLDRGCVPPRALVSADASVRRRGFSALHELGHVLRNLVPEVVRAVFAEPDRGRALEEVTCDAFAAAVLLPRSSTDKIFVEGVTARSVVEMFHASSASRMACCVAAARYLPSSGLVMLCRPIANGADAEGLLVAAFTAPHGDALPVARDVPQDADVLARGWQIGKARGQGQPKYRSGNHGRELLVDVVRDDEHALAVWMEHSPAWGGLTLPPRQGPAGVEGYCGNCDHSFHTFAGSCAACGSPLCPSCGQCDCAEEYRPTRGQRSCQRCFQVLPASAFDDDGEVCNQH